MEGGWEDNVADHGSYLFSCHTANLNKSGQGGNVDMNQFVRIYFSGWVKIFQHFTKKNPIIDTRT